jgi:hypothetical protein
MRLDFIGIDEGFMKVLCGFERESVLCGSAPEKSI